MYRLFDKVDINRAGVLEFMNVPGISQDMAKAIVKFRKSQGNFEDIEELKNVKGIKDKKLEKLRKYLKLG